MARQIYGVWTRTSRRPLPRHQDRLETLSEDSNASLQARYRLRWYPHGPHFPPNFPMGRISRRSLDAEEQIALEVVFRDGAVRIHNLGCVNVFKCQE